MLFAIRRDFPQQFKAVFGIYRPVLFMQVPNMAIRGKHNIV